MTAHQISPAAASAREQHRDPQGKFGAQPHAESDVDLDAGTGPPDDDDLRDGTNVLTPSLEQTRQPFVDAVRELDRTDPGDYRAMAEAEEEVRATAVRHSATEEGRDEVQSHLGDHRLAGVATGWADLGARRAAELEPHAQDGVGAGAEPMPVAEVRRRLQPGQPVEVTYLGGRKRRPELRTVTGQTSYEMRTTRADGTTVHNPWAGRQAWEDESGNMIVGDSHGEPYAVYRPAEAAPVRRDDGSADGAQSIQRLFPLTGKEPGIPLNRITVEGEEYVTNRYSAVRADHVRPRRGTERTAEDDNLGVISAFGRVDKEDTVPVREGTTFQASVAGPMVKAGYEIRAAGEPADNQQARTHHVFNGDEHIGWVMSRSERVDGQGVTLDQLTEIADGLDAGARHARWEQAQRDVLG